MANDATDATDATGAPTESLTRLLQSWRQGSGTAFGDLLDQVYDQLRAIAAKRLGQGGRATTP